MLYIIFILMIIIGIAFMVWGIKTWRRYTFGLNILDTILSTVFGIFEHTGLGRFLLGLLMVYLGIMKLIHGPNWGVNP